MKAQIKANNYLYLGIALFAYINTASANGFRLPEYTAAGTATSNALVADDSRISAIAYNPAIMAIYTAPNKENTHLFSANMVQIKYDTEVTTSSGTSQSTGQSTFNIPNLFVSSEISDKLSLGFLVHSPFGLETAWPKNTFPPFGGASAVEINLSRIKMFNTNLNLGYQLSSDTGFAFGINRYELLDLQFNSHATIIKGSGDGYGWNAALFSKHDNVAIGLSYRSAVHAHANGSASTSPVTPIEVDVTFPEMLTLGVSYAFSDAFKFEFDIEHTGWRVYDNLNIRRSADQSTLTLSTNNWEDTLTYRISGQYKIHRQQILFGYAYDETPQPDAYFSARIPGTDRELFSIGYQYDFGNYQIEAGFLLVKFKNRTFSSSNSYVFGQEPNGTTAYNGTYRSSATVLSVGVSTAF